MTASPDTTTTADGVRDDLIEELRDEATKVLQQLARDDVSEIKLLQEHLHDSLGQLVYDRTRRRPMILPVVIEI